MIRIDAPVDVRELPNGWVPVLAIAWGLFLSPVAAGDVERVSDRCLENAAWRAVTGDTVCAEREGTHVQAFLITVASIVVGGGLAGATVVGLVNSQTAPPEESPGDVSNPVLVYGTTN